MDAKEILDSILGAIDVVATQRIQSAPHNITILGKVINIDNKINGEYKVEYGNTILTVYSDAALYSINDMVYVLIPNNDFNMTKFIIGKKR